jgi:hypothetical protein
MRPCDYWCHGPWPEAVLGYRERGVRVHAESREVLLSLKAGE